MRTPDQPLEDWAAGLPPRGRLLGIDPGAKRMGLALSDLDRTIASPLMTLERGKFAKDLEAIRALIAEHGIVGIVIGLPRNMDGSEGPSAQSARALMRNLAGAIALPMAFWDERLSTMAVTRTLLEADASRKRRAELVDKLAAAYILQGALDRLRSRPA